MFLSRLFLFDLSQWFCIIIFSVIFISCVFFFCYIADVDCSNAQGYDTGIGGSTSTIVSPLGSPQPQLRSQVQRANAAALARYMQVSVVYFFVFFFYFQITNIKIRETEWECGNIWTRASHKDAKWSELKHVGVYPQSYKGLHMWGIFFFAGWSDMNAHSVYVANVLFVFYIFLVYYFYFCCFFFLFL